MRLKRRLIHWVLPKKVQERRLALRRKRRTPSVHLGERLIRIATLKGRYDGWLLRAESGDQAAQIEAIKCQAAIILGLRKLARNGGGEALPGFMERHKIPRQWLKQDSSPSSRSA